MAGIRKDERPYCIPRLRPRTSTPTTVQVSAISSTPHHIFSCVQNWNEKLYQLDAGSHVCAAFHRGRMILDAQKHHLRESRELFRDRHCAAFVICLGNILDCGYLASE